jgi:hypothetical protein
MKLNSSEKLIKIIFIILGLVLTSILILIIASVFFLLFIQEDSSVMPEIYENHTCLENYNLIMKNKLPFCEPKKLYDEPLFCRDFKPTCINQSYIEMKSCNPLTKDSYSLGVFPCPDKGKCLDFSSGRCVSKREETGCQIFLDEKSSDFSNAVIYELNEECEKLILRNVASKEDDIIIGIKPSSPILKGDWIGKLDNDCNLSYYIFDESERVVSKKSGYALNEMKAFFIGIEKNDCKKSQRFYLSTIKTNPGEKQTFFINFEHSGEINMKNYNFNIHPFSAEQIFSNYENQTEELKKLLLKKLEKIYENISVEFTYERPLDEPYHTVYFGSYSKYFLGIAEGANDANSRKSQVAIIFTDTFKEQFRHLSPSLDEISNALAKVTAHESAHLLGLIHQETTSGEVMAIGGSLKSYLRENSFRVANLHENEFSLGGQDSIDKLSKTVGTA